MFIWVECVLNMYVICVLMGKHYYIGDRFWREDLCKDRQTDIVYNYTFFLYRNFHLSVPQGSCRGYIIKWYYSSPRNRCARFVYTGCDGNANQFDSEEACKEKCLRTDVVRPTRRPSFTRRPTYFTRRPTYLTRRPFFTRRPTYLRTTTTTTPAPITTRSTTQSNIIPRQCMFFLF